MCLLLIRLLQKCPGVFAECAPTTGLLRPFFFVQYVTNVHLTNIHLSHTKQKKKAMIQSLSRISPPQKLP